VDPEQLSPLARTGTTVIMISALFGLLAALSLYHDPPKGTTIRGIEGQRDPKRLSRRTGYLVSVGILSAVLGSLFMIF
jgi:hypothetical protein